METPFITPHPTSNTLSLIEARTFQPHEVSNEYRMSPEKLSELRTSFKQWFKESAAKK